MEYFNSVIKSDVPVVVDFYAEWCGPCKKQAVILGEVENELGSTVKIVKINVEEHPDVSDKYNIKNIPTIIILRGGDLVHRTTGLITKDNLIKTIKSI